MKKPSPFDILQREAPAKDLDERWQQRVHQICGGELVIITKHATEAICCKKCKAIWNLPDFRAPVDWDVPRPEKVSSGLWVPGKIQ